MPPPKDEPGLLSKVVRFVKNPTTNWTDLEQQEAERESSYSKQMLKEMIERKRRNDFVRKREFDMLRKMRRSEVLAGQDPAARPSFFQSSMPSKPDDRATTLKKIDEIEAQMSMQWWKTKHGADSLRPSGSSTNFPMSAPMPPDAPGRPVGSPTLKSTAYTRTSPQDLPGGTPDAGSGADEPMLDFSQVFNKASAPAPVENEPVARAAPPGSSGMPRGAPTAAPLPPAAAPAVRPPLMSPMSMHAPGPASEAGGPSSAFSASKIFAIDVDEFAHDPELEEAAIRFANGDDAGAEAGLREVLAPGGPRIDHEETWLTLFDLYRAAGWHDKFEIAAIDFAGRFGRSAPQWFSMPEVVGRIASQGSAPAAAAPQSQAHWTCPATLGTQTVAALNAALAKSPQPWQLSWAKLTTIQEAAVEPLTRVVGQWAAQPVQLRFVGADALEKVLKDATPSGDRTVAAAWWKLRMELLRVMHRPDEFELVALDYCVTYEVSPPSWESARCEYKPLQADGSYEAGHTIVGEAFRDSLASGMQGYSDTHMAQQSQMASNVATVELAGQVLGDASEVLDMLEARVYGADVMIISCARLIRIDFSAAGTLLNWATSRQAEGRQVQFVDVHRLVAAFFNVIGISEHARVLPRHD